MPLNKHTKINETKRKQTDNRRSRRTTTTSTWRPRSTIYDRAI